MRNMRNTRNLLLSVLLAVSVSAFVEELDDSFLETRAADDIWLIKFYAPWCSFCKQLDSVWHQVGSELRSLGSPVTVGKSDATASRALAKEFRVRGYPAILMWKKGVMYNYSGPRTKDGILDFAHRVGGPLVRSLSSQKLFQHAMSRHDIMVIYVGATSPLKGNFTSAAEELIVHTYFFSASKDVLPKVVSLPLLPAVVLLKDGTFFTFNEDVDGDLRSWINRERFPNFIKIDSYTLYAMGETGKLVLVALVKRGVCEKSQRFKGLVEKVSSEQREKYSRWFYFGFMEDSEYVKGLVMDDVVIPSFIVVNLSNDGYFLPTVVMETELHLLDFLDGVLNGSVHAQGGNDVIQRIRRLIFDAKTTLQPMMRQAPLLSFLLIGFLLSVSAVLCYLCLRKRPGVHDDDNDDEDGVLLASSVQRRRKQAEKKSD